MRAHKGGTHTIKMEVSPHVEFDPYTSSSRKLNRFEYVKL